MYLLVAVALPDDAPAALFQISRSPRAVQVVERHKPVLYVHASAHLEGAAHEYTHLTAANFCKQFLLSDFRIRLMDECDLLAGDSSGNELFPNVVVDGKGRLLRFGFRINGRLQRVKLRAVRAFRGDPAALRRFTLGGGKVAEHELCQLIRLPVLPDAVDVVHAAIDLAVRVVRQVRVDDALIEAQLAPIRGDFEHIVLACVHAPRVNFCGALGQLLHHLLLQRRGLCDLGVVDCVGRGKVKLVGGLDVRRLPEQVHQLRQVKELGKPRPRPVACPLRRKLDGGGGFPKGGGPAIEVGQAVALEHIVLQIPHHGIQFRHGI